MAGGRAAIGGVATRLALVLLAGGSLAACASVTPRYATNLPAHARPAPAAPGGYKVGEPYQVGGIWYVPHEQPDYDEVGIASWYGDAFNLKPTANGEVFDMAAVSAAHTTLPLPSMVEVTNLENGRKLQVRVNDRGPFVGGRIIDLSHEAARELGYDVKGTAKVRVRYLGPAPLLGPDAGVRVAQAAPPRSPAIGPAAPAALAPAPSLPPGPRPVETAELAPLSPAAVPTPPLAPPIAEPAPGASASLASASLPAASGLRVQAGAFADPANAERAVSQLASAGHAVIEPLQREGNTLYRVVLPAPSDEAAAYALRDRVAEIGFADARVVRAF